ncbi:MAG: hypothetical protein AAF674_08720 [Pseudomonadota bacterium]
MKRLLLAMTATCGLSLHGAAMGAEIAVTLPDTVDLRDASRLSVAVNGRDYTAHAVLEGGRLVISDAAGAFSPDNEVRLFLETADGFDEVAVWTVPYAPKDGLSGSGSAGPAFGATFTDGTNFTVAGISGEVAASGRYGAWAIDLAASNQTQLSAPAELDRVTEAHLSVVAERSGDIASQVIRAGDQVLGGGALVLPADERLGVSLGVDAAGHGVAAESFAFVNRVIEDDDVRYDGGFSGASFSIDAARGLTLQGSATVGEGRRTDGDPDRRGFAGGGGFRWLSDSGNIEFGGEGAFSRNTIPGVGGETGHAVAAWASYEHVLAQEEGAQALSIAGRYQQVARDYYAFGAPDLAADTRQLSVTVDYATRDFSLAGFVVLDEDNVARDPAAGINQVAEIGLNLSYALSPEWTLAVGTGASFAFLKDSPNAEEPDSSGLTGQLYTGLTYQTGAWSLSTLHVIAQTRGDGVFDQDVLTYQGEVSGAWQAHDALDIAAYAQVTAMRDSTAPDSVAASIGASLTWVLSDTVDLAASFDAAAADQPDFDGSDARISLGWQLSDTATATFFAGHSSGTLAPTAPFSGTYAGLTISLAAPFAF